MILCCCHSVIRLVLWCKYTIIGCRACIIIIDINEEKVVKKISFNNADCLFAGINTGTLGFAQDICIDNFIMKEIMGYLLFVLSLRLHNFYI